MENQQICENRPCSPLALSAHSKRSSRNLAQKKLIIYRIRHHSLVDFGHPMSQDIKERAKKKNPPLTQKLTHLASFFPHPVVKKNLYEKIYELFLVSFSTQLFLSTKLQYRTNIKNFSKPQTKSTGSKKAGRVRQNCISNKQQTFARVIFA